MHGEFCSYIVSYRVFLITGCQDYLQPVLELIVVCHSLLLELNMANILTPNINHPSFLAAKIPSNWLARPIIMIMLLGERQY
jgi:hypothetical protein